MASAGGLGGARGLERGRGAILEDEVGWAWVRSERRFGARVPARHVPKIIAPDNFKINLVKYKRSYKIYDLNLDGLIPPHRTQPLEPSSMCVYPCTFPLLHTLLKCQAK
jgi:hypothetical protein